MNYELEDIRERLDLLRPRLPEATWDWCLEAVAGLAKVAGYLSHAPTSPGARQHLFQGVCPPAAPSRQPAKRARKGGSAK